MRAYVRACLFVGEWVHVLVRVFDGIFIFLSFILCVHARVSLFAHVCTVYVRVCVRAFACE